MTMGLSDLGNSILAKPGGLQEEAVMQGESDTGQRLSGRLSGGRRRISPLCRGSWLVSCWTTSVVGHIG